MGSPLWPEDHPGASSHSSRKPSGTGLGVLGNVGRLRIQKQSSYQAKTAKALLEQGFPSQVVQIQPRGATAARRVPGGSGMPRPRAFPPLSAAGVWLAGRGSWAGGVGRGGHLRRFTPHWEQGKARGGPEGLTEGEGPREGVSGRAAAWWRARTREHGRAPGMRRLLAGRPSGGMPRTAWPGSAVEFVESADLPSPEARRGGDRKELAAHIGITFLGHHSHQICQLCARGRACWTARAGLSAFPGRRLGTHPCLLSLSGSLPIASPWLPPKLWTAVCLSLGIRTRRKAEGAARPH